MFLEGNNIIAALHIVKLLFFKYNYFVFLRRSNNEDDNSDLNDEEIKVKFMFLSRANKLLKSRDCEDVQR